MMPILSLSAGLLPSIDEKLSSFSQPEATIVCLPTSVPPCDSFKFSMLALFGTNGMTTS